MNKAAPDIHNTLLTIRDYIRWAASRFNEAKLFYGHGTATALDDASALILPAIFQPYDLSDDYLDAVLTGAEREKITGLVERRINERIPVAYLTHEAIFAGLSFYVDERVLIPRSPIAELIDAQFSPWVAPEQVNRILDLCTGSACIAIACAYAFPDAAVDAVDLSTAALQVAQQNVTNYALEEQLNLVQSDLFHALEDSKYDVIVSNPPYVCRSEWEQLPAEYHFEPQMGFDGGCSGLDIVIRILANAAQHLTEQGILVVEVGSSAETLQQQYPEIPFYWLDFERGGDGVFLLTSEQVLFYTEFFQSLLK